ncbi:MAG: glucosamine-6-phosphate deaminase [Mariniblastus sp.]
MISNDVKTMGQNAAAAGAVILRQALAAKGTAAIIVATGSSQFEVLNALVDEPEIDWSRVTGFHLDEYLQLPENHPASFRKYLKERFVSKIPIGSFHYVDGEVDPEAECQRLGELISAQQIDVAFIGIGENGHLAFNDPPADFETEAPYIVVELDEACRQQQHGEGWFNSMKEVPTHAISMSIRQIIKSKSIICTVPDERKAVAVRDSVEGEVTPTVPGSILQKHENATLFLDTTAASLLSSDA